MDDSEPHFALARDGFSHPSRTLWLSVVCGYILAIWGFLLGGWLATVVILDSPDDVWRPIGAIAVTIFVVAYALPCFILGLLLLFEVARALPLLIALAIHAPLAYALRDGMPADLLLIAFCVLLTTALLEPLIWDQQGELESTPPSD